MSDDTLKKLNSTRGVSMQKLNLVMAVVTLVISVLLLFAVYRTGIGYHSMRDTTDRYIDKQQRAFELQISSDYLTEQVRCFTVTGERVYLDNYFEEAKVTRRRDKALEALSEDMADSEAYNNLTAAMEKSVTLMDREYYAMRLTVDAFGYDLADFPAEVQSVVLDAAAQALPPEEKEALARAMVFDDNYHAQKQAISDSMQKCLNALVEETDREMGGATDDLHKLIKTEQWLIIIMIIVVLSIVLLTFLLVISPLLRAVIKVRADQPLPVRGSYEFRFLAKTYNLMYEANRESKEQLAYKATHDQLTKLYNRSGFEFLRKNMDFDNAALLLFDVDKFKRVNDSNGHDIGDEVLVKVADVVRGAFRSGDYICRIGGDEFAAIMIAAGRSNIPLIRGKINYINKLLANTDDGLPPVSISCGVAFGGAGLDIRDIYRQADVALYSVKNAGGRGCSFFEELDADKRTVAAIDEEG